MKTSVTSSLPKGPNKNPKLGRCMSERIVNIYQSSACLHESKTVSDLCQVKLHIHNKKV